jgi:hypothetical protein
MSRRYKPLQSLGFATVLALGALGVTTSPVFAQITAVTIDPEGSVAQPGGATATVSGTLTCTNGTNNLNVTVSQRRGQSPVATAFGFTSLPCALTQPQTWILTARTSVGSLNPGPAVVEVTVINVGPNGPTADAAAATVRLRPE